MRLLFKLQDPDYLGVSQPETTLHFFDLDTSGGGSHHLNKKNMITKEFGKGIKRKEEYEEGHASEQRAQFVSQLGTEVFAPSSYLVRLVEHGNFEEGLFVKAQHEQHEVALARRPSQALGRIKN